MTDLGSYPIIEDVEPNLSVLSFQPINFQLLAICFSSWVFLQVLFFGVLISAYDQNISYRHRLSSDRIFVLFVILISTCSQNHFLQTKYVCSGICRFSVHPAEVCFCLSKINRGSNPPLPIDGIGKEDQAVGKEPFFDFLKGLGLGQRSDHMPQIHQLSDHWCQDWSAGGIVAMWESLAWSEVLSQD